MDRIKETANLIIQINKFRKNQISDYELIKSTSNFFDLIKNDNVSQADLRFLRYVANVTGIPHYYDVLEKFGNDIQLEEHDLSTISSLVYESTLHTNENSKVHRYQKVILDLFQPKKLNRYFLSASTSFGKTHIVFEIIKKMKYSNVVLIFPTIALLSENLEKLLANADFDYFKDKYKIHTLSDVQEFSERNLFIYTPERFLSFIDKNENALSLDFAFIDEVYKIDNDYIIDEEIKEDERDVSYRLAVYYSLRPSVDVLLAGPYIDFSNKNSKNYNSSFDVFLKKNSIELLDFNNYEIVNKSFANIKSAKKTLVDDQLSFEFQHTTKTSRLIEIIKEIVAINENTIVYCSARSYVESTAKLLINAGILAEHDSQPYLQFLKHIEKNFGNDWVVYEALNIGIGIHHGLVPKYIQKEIVHLFNKGFLKVLISTTTITEGVNTSAKNLVVLHHKKGDKELKKFDARNIAGRAGRFLYHYSGRVIVLQNDFMKSINAPAEPIKHKNYDFESPKSEIDIYYSDEEYLSLDDRNKKTQLARQQELRKIPNNIFNTYKVVNRSDKILVYDKILELNPIDFISINRLISKLNREMDIDSEGFQIVINILLPIVKNSKLIDLIERKDKNNRYSILTHFVHFYLKGGFVGSMNYKLKQGKSKNDAIKETAEFVYNTLKFQLVKYLGVFNIMYKFHQSNVKNKNFDDISGIDPLLTKLEYNALTENGKIASDYGVPSNVVKYFEDLEERDEIRGNFDSFENLSFDKINDIIKGRI